MPIATDGDLAGELVGRSFAGDFVALLAGDGELRADGMPGYVAGRFEIGLAASPRGRLGGKDTDALGSSKCKDLCAGPRFTGLLTSLHP